MKTRIVILLVLVGSYLYSVHALNEIAQQSLSSLSDLYTHPEAAYARFELANR